MFLISSYDAPLVQSASYLAQQNSLFGSGSTVNYAYIVTNSINSLLIGSRCIHNGFWPMLQNNDAAVTLVLYHLVLHMALTLPIRNIGKDLTHYT